MDAKVNPRPEALLAPRGLWAALLGPRPSAGPAELRQARDARAAVALFALSAAAVLTAIGLGGLGVVLAGVAAAQALTAGAIQFRLMRSRRSDR